MSDPGDTDPLTGMNTSPDRVYYDYDKDGRSTSSFGTQWEADAAGDARAQKELQDLNNANISAGLQPNLSSRPKAIKGSSSGCLKTTIIVVVVVVVIIIVVVVLLSLLGNYAANHINQHG
jgi:hypothetical protein